MNPAAVPGAADLRETGCFARNGDPHHPQFLVAGDRRGEAALTGLAIPVFAPLAQHFQDLAVGVHERTEGLDPALEIPSAMVGSGVQPPLVHGKVNRHCGVGDGIALPQGADQGIEAQGSGRVGVQPPELLAKLPELFEHRCQALLPDVLARAQRFIVVLQAVNLLQEVSAQIFAEYQVQSAQHCMRRGAVQFGAAVPRNALQLLVKNLKSHEHAGTVPQGKLIQRFGAGARAGEVVHWRDVCCIVPYLIA